FLLCRAVSGRLRPHSLLALNQFVLGSIPSRPIAQEPTMQSQKPGDAIVLMMSLARRPSRPRIRLIVLCASVAACAMFQPDWRLAPSVIGSDRPTLPAVDIPDTLTAGVPATVTAWTKMGWEGCERPGTARVK